MPTPAEYLVANHTTFLEDLKAFLRIQSVSTLREKNPETRQAAAFVVDHLKAAGMTRVELFETNRHPIVYGEWLGAPGKPTVLVYGHYDVQPADKVKDKWTTDPFEPVVVDGKLYARGSTDDKGQILADIKAAQAWMQTTGSLPVNIKFLVEGEEEIGSENLDAFIETHLDLLRCDVAVVSDTAVVDLNTPSLTYALRGLVYMELEVWGPKVDLHSGQWGGSVHNPLQALCEIITALHNPDGSISVTGFYDKAKPISAEERAAIAEVPLTEESWRASTGAAVAWGEPAYTLRERISARPTLEVHGLIGGFTGEGSKTVLPASAKAKISCRLIPDQDPFEIYDLIKQYVATITPPAVRSEVRLLNTGYPAMVPIDSRAVAAAKNAYTRGWGKQPVFVREGGSIPVVATFNKHLGAPVLLVGYGLPDDGAHGPDEHFYLDCFYKGMATMAALLENLGGMTPDEVRG
ncbi:MAG TPA: dipeptidase [Aggregatilineales bacterium]|nr:dipeptidase [Anaerolineales bacterium]HRE48980.1 dipeptidase [Aggregatilineales bacterium]